ncbi:hypothetical protein BDF14DRAFT_1770596 [Spinellus fusiger]|nr:hypothetical protein BDF14DRAFT_1770596 [Spinellus fusiger]
MDWSYFTRPLLFSILSTVCTSMDNHGVVPTDSGHGLCGLPPPEIKHMQGVFAMALVPVERAWTPHLGLDGMRRYHPIPSHLIPCTLLYTP